MEVTQRVTPVQIVIEVTLRFVINIQIAIKVVIHLLLSRLLLISAVRSPG